jgi:hypothetical protein
MTESWPKFKEFPFQVTQEHFLANKPSLQAARVSVMSQVKTKDELKDMGRELMMLQVIMGFYQLVFW